jgi:hypothetical protein
MSSLGGSGGLSLSLQSNGVIRAQQLETISWFQEPKIRGKED